MRVIIDDLKPGEDIPSEFVVGRKYHCSWAKKRGMVWRLISYDETTGEAMLKTPSTKRELKTQLSSLRDINKTIFEKRKKSVTTTIK